MQAAVDVVGIVSFTSGVALRTGEVTPQTRPGGGCLRAQVTLHPGTRHAPRGRHIVGLVTCGAAHVVRGGTASGRAPRASGRSEHRGPSSLVPDAWGSASARPVGRGPVRVVGPGSEEGRHRTDTVTEAADRLRTGVRLTDNESAAPSGRVPQVFTLRALRAGPAALPRSREIRPDRARSAALGPGEPGRSSSAAESQVRQVRVPSAERKFVFN